MQWNILSGLSRSLCVNCEQQFHLSVLGGKSLGVKQEDGEEVVVESMMVPPVFPRFWRQGKLTSMTILWPKISDILNKERMESIKTTFFRAGQSRGTRTHPVWRNRDLKGLPRFDLLLSWESVSKLINQKELPKIYLLPCCERKEAQAAGWGEIPTEPPGDFDIVNDSWFIFRVTKAI